MEVAERWRVSIREMIIPSVGKITASFGVAECPIGGQTSTEMLQSVDVALYEAKRSGRDRVVAWQPVKSNLDSDADANSVVVPDVQSDELVQ